ILKQKILTAARGVLDKLRQTTAAADVAALKERLVALTKAELLTAGAHAAGPRNAAAPREKLPGLPDKMKTQVQELLGFDALTVPAGTPLNLYFNLNAGALPYAIKAQLKYRRDPRKLAETLLRLSDCPDLVEDRGHTYGAQLNDNDKKDLIE